ncbi:hypothetical protein VTJ04DRAFT_1180 [Mycothermus thermophilus]|uniref:uncharacterized protein n=1 Tax=Humicola insolens TaxID=85995 RepID=UPI003742CD7F
MLDENLPTFRLKPSTDNPHSSIYYLTQNGSEPVPEYVLRRPDPALPESKNKYAIAVCDPYNADVVYGEVVVEPAWVQPTLSTAEIRAQAQGTAPAAPSAAIVPDTFTVQLYNPDQSVSVKFFQGAWAKSDTWEFELPVQSFKMPTASAIDREQKAGQPAVADLSPRVMFRWKRDGLLSKDITCYLSGRRIGARKNRDPDITVAMYKSGRESALTLYQPNMHRVEVEDRKGLEIVLLLASEVIKDLWLVQKPDVFNIGGGAAATTRKNSRPAVAMSGAIPGPSTQPNGTTASTSEAAAAAAAVPKPSKKGPSDEIDEETKKVIAMVQQEEREREKARIAEEKRLKKLREEREKERRRREAEVEKETERLRRLYGVEGQELPSERPKLPPRPPQQPQHQAAPPVPPPRPVSAGPYSQRPGSSSGGHGHGHGHSQGNSPNPGQGPFTIPALNSLWKGASIGLQTLQTQIEKHQQTASGSGTKPSSGKKRSDDDGGRLRRKKSY